MTALPAAVRVLLSSDSLVVLPGEDLSPAEVRQMAPGQRIALAQASFGSRRRLRRCADRLGLRIEAEYAVLPTWERAAFVVEDHPSTLSWLFATLATVPPGMARGAGLLDVGLRGSRRAGLARLSGRVVPGRLLVASRR